MQPHATEPSKPATKPGQLWNSPEFGSVYAEHSRAIYYLALRLLNDTALAEDAVQDVFLKAWKNFHTFRGDSAIRTWLYRITVNHCQNLLQSWQKRNIFPQGDATLIDTAGPSPHTPLRLLETKELGEVIQKSLDALPTEYRLLLLLVADEALSYQDIATVTNQSADAVRGKLHRARRAFAERFRSFS
ncbi:MAG: polymerase sigma-E factor [Verrucomicrobiota bacterium]|jgi:RNA polymerase sigma-70 factor (ECF subfamily)